MSLRPDERYPLTWPPGWPRTPAWRRTNSPFKGNTPERAMRELLDELQRLGARNVIVSSNLKLRQDGLPYANQPRHDDEGIAVYFTRKGKEMVLACDKFARREDNMRAITKTIDAIRGIERWGSSDLMERAFTGFAQLGHDGARKWWDVLGVSTRNQIPVLRAYRAGQCDDKRVTREWLDAANDARREVAMKEGRLDEFDAEREIVAATVKAIADKINSAKDPQP